MNALTFYGYLFSKLHNSNIAREWERHDRAVERLQAGQAEWTRRWAERLDWINEELRRQRHAVQTFHDVNIAMREYAQVTGRPLDPLGPKPRFSDFYQPSPTQKNREIAFVALGMAATSFIAFKLM